MLSRGHTLPLPKTKATVITVLEVCCGACRGGGERRSEVVGERRGGIIPSPFQQNGTPGSYRPRGLNLQRARQITAARAPTVPRRTYSYKGQGSLHAENPTYGVTGESHTGRFRGSQGFRQGSRRDLFSQTTYLKCKQLVITKVQGKVRHVKLKRSGYLSKLR